MIAYRESERRRCDQVDSSVSQIRTTSMQPRLDMSRYKESHLQRDISWISGSSEEQKLPKVGGFVFHRARSKKETRKRPNPRKRPRRLQGFIFILHNTRMRTRTRQRLNSLHTDRKIRNWYVVPILASHGLYVHEMSVTRDARDYSIG